MVGRPTDPYPLAPPGQYAGGPSGPQPVAVVSAPPVEPGYGWYYAHFPPPGVDWFHHAFQRQILALAAGNVIDLTANGTPFTVPTGQVYLITDWMFHAWRTDPSGFFVPLGRNDFVGFIHFRFEIDGSPVRMSLYTQVLLGGGGVARSDNFPFLETRPGPQLQSTGFAVHAPARPGQTIRGFADVLTVPVGIGVPRLGFEYSGIRMPASAYMKYMKGS